MPTARRDRELRDFRAAARAVVSNARCLTEDVDVPAVDMVAFLSPRLYKLTSIGGRWKASAPDKSGCQQRQFAMDKRGKCQFNYSNLS